MNSLCECGCGERVTRPGNRFICWHNARNRIVSLETRRKMSEAHKGKKQSAETRRKISKALTGIRRSEETKRKISEVQKGKKLSQQQRRDMSRRLKGKPSPMKGKTRSHEFRRKIAQVTKGERNPFWGKKHSEETKSKISKARTGICSGEDHHNWRGGNSFEPYAPEFNRALKGTIRERDQSTCQLCGARENGHPLACHHIDYDKANNAPENLVALCTYNGCHSRTAYNRAFYTNLFQARMKMGLSSGGR